MIDRRTLFANAALAGGGLLASSSGLAATSAPTKSLPSFYTEIERRTFNFFWETVNKSNGLVPDRWPTPSFASIAAVGFGLTAYPIGVARGWIKREAARDLTLTTLRFFDNAPMGDDREGMTGHRGFFYHFLDMQTGVRFRTCELSSVDSSLLFLGMLFAGQYYDRNDPVEAEIRRLSAAIVDRADWPWFQRGEAAVSMGWDPVKGFIARNWDGYNEGMMVYILGLGATRRPLPDDAWSAWTAPYPNCWRGEGPTRHLGFGPLFGHQYSHMWIDFRGIKDVVMRGAGFDYFENSRRATYAQRAYGSANPLKWEGWSKNVWGLTACDGPGGFKLPYKGETREFFAYAARGPIGQPDERDDGTIAPTAALGSLAFAPEIVIPAARAMRRQPGLWGKYGFLDSFNPSFRYTEEPIQTGTVDRKHGWVAKDFLGIDQGPILGAAANYRDEMIWKAMRGSPVIRRGLERAGFTGGWLAG